MVWLFQGFNYKTQTKQGKQMETLIIIAGLIVLWMFRKAIRGTADTLELTVNEGNRAAGDSLPTWGNEVAVLNAEQRSDQFKRISKIDHLVTNDELADLLYAAKNTPNPAAKPRSRAKKPAQTTEA